MQTLSEQAMENGPTAVEAPRVIVFACRWCALIGADAAGRQRAPLPDNFRLIPVECISRVEPDAVIRAFSLGIDGVAVLGCHVGGCRFNDANHRCLKRMELLRGLLDTVGLDARRLHTGYGNAHEHHQFVAALQAFVTELAALPPLAGRGTNHDGQARTAAAGRDDG